MGLARQKPQSYPPPPPHFPGGPAGFWSKCITVLVVGGGVTAGRRLQAQQGERQTGCDRASRHWHWPEGRNQRATWSNGAPPGMHLEEGGAPPPPPTSRAPSPCPATVSLTAGASFHGT